MDTNAPKTPAALPFAAWQAMTPHEAAREVHARIAALPDTLRAAALAWLRPESELAVALALKGGPVSRRAAPDGAEIVPPPPDAQNPLHGVPYLLKDLFDLAGVPTRAGSTFLERARATPDKDCVFASLLGQLGASCAGKTHLVEFASGLTGENPHYGDCPHPQFPDRLSGGSSSGSAALVAAGAVPLAVGTDTGGSVRVPAAWCGLYGFRLTPRDELIHDAFPLAPTMDTAGWFTANAGDMLATWQAVAWRAAARQQAGLGQQSGPAKSAGPAILESSAEFRGCYLPTAALLATADAETIRACDASAAKLCPSADAAIQDALLHSWRDAVEAYLTIGMSEANAVHRDWLAPYREHYDPVIWRRFTDAGRFPPDQIVRAHATLAEVRSALAHYFSTHDFLVLPAVPCPAPRKADCTPALRRNILTLTAPASLAGLPVLSVPVALPSGLTAGLQIILPATNSPVVEWALGK